jgi:hypothetical protein
VEIEPVDLLTTYLSQHEEEDSLSDPLILIPTFENLFYLKNTLNQLKKRNMTRIVILDGGSEDDEMVSYLGSLPEAGFCVIQLTDNPGPRWCWEDKSFYDALPDVFCVTDPDLLFNPELPDHFIETLWGLTEEFEIGKAAFALTLSEEVDASEFFAGGRFRTIHSWEARHWEKPLQSRANVEVYLAETDTTFAVYNKRFFSPASPYRAVRVAGIYAAKHIPWFPELRKNFVTPATRGAHSWWEKGNEIVLIKKALNELETELKAIKSSFAWRGTAPVRFVLDRLWFFLSRLRASSRGKPEQSRSPRPD